MGAPVRHLKGLGRLRRKLAQLAQLEQPLADEAYELARLLNQSRLSKDEKKAHCRARD